MNSTEKFLKTDLTEPKNKLIELFVQSINEIRSEELSITMDSLEKYGDIEANNLINNSSIQDICLHTNNVKLEENIPERAQRIIDNYNLNDAVTVFRGTRLPLAGSSFKNGYVHTTPHFATSAAYAVGISNSYGSIGRLLTQDEDNIGLGFIHAYNAPLPTLTYKNFQFERFINGASENTSISLNDFKRELESFARLEKSSFSVEYFSEKDLYGPPTKKIKMSPNMQKWHDFITSTKCMDTPYYEVMLPENSEPKYTFLIDKNTKLIKLNLQNPKIKKVLNKLQELLLKDFYEIAPLDKLKSEIVFNISQINENHISSKEHPELFKLLLDESIKLKELKENVVNMIETLKKNSSLSEESLEKLMNESKMVGSTNMIGEKTQDSKLSYHSFVENFIKDIETKKQIIEQPLQEFLKKQTIVLPNNMESSSMHLLDKLLYEIKEKNSQANLKDVDTDGVMLDLIQNIEKSLCLKKKKVPTVIDFIKNLEHLKNVDTIRNYCEQPLFTDKYKPFFQYILNKTINEFSKHIGTPIITEIDKKNFEKVSSSIENIRSKFSQRNDKKVENR